MEHILACGSSRFLDDSKEFYVQLGLKSKKDIPGKIKCLVSEYETIKDIEIECAKSIAGYVKEQQEFHNEEVVERADGSVIVHIEEAPEHEIVKWILSEGGEAKVVKPKSLAKKIVQAAEKVAKANRR
jgi:predicted DNA-binding transcriptional regulator YafY